MKYQIVEGMFMFHNWSFCHLCRSLVLNKISIIINESCNGLYDSIIWFKILLVFYPLIAKYGDGRALNSTTVHHSNHSEEFNYCI